ncbi:MAG: DNA/RNA nuclease SfsA [Candidatus Thorarchaeota archaeon]
MNSKKPVVKCTFVERPNRFLGRVKIRDQVVEVFIPNPGRMYELMVPGKTAYVRENSGPHRKTSYDMIAVEHDGLVVSIDSNLPNRFLKELLQSREIEFFGDYDRVIPEPRVYNGRFDFLLKSESGDTFIEVKSCTLVEEGRARFPDAPTTRGARHMRHLVRALNEKIVAKAAVVFVIQRPDAMVFSPNDPTDPEFSDALRAAKQNGVEVIPLVCEVVDWELELKTRIPHDLDHFIK